MTKLIAEKKLSAVEVTNKDGSVQTLEINGLFVAVGRIPENQKVLRPLYILQNSSSCVLKPVMYALLLIRKTVVIIFT